MATDTHGSSCQPRSCRYWLRIAAIGRSPRRTLLRAAILAVLCVIVSKWILLPARTEGISMAPTCADGSFHFINRLSYLWHEPRRGDVVAIRFTDPVWWVPPHRMLLKRIIGLPGEAISFVDGRVLVNGRLLAEPYEKGPCDWNRAPVTLEADEYLVVGDNRSMPKELHYFGIAKRSRIVGKALL